MDDAVSPILRLFFGLKRILLSKLVHETVRQSLLLRGGSCHADGVGDAVANHSASSQIQA